MEQAWCLVVRLHRTCVETGKWTFNERYTRNNNTFSRGCGEIERSHGPLPAFTVHTDGDSPHGVEHVVWCA
eukprot:46955-Eustigmatos_ZCMA.PRE.1